MKQSQRERIQYIHDCLKIDGNLTILGLKNRFKISQPTASKSVKIYKELFPLNMQFDVKKRLYLKINTFVDGEIPQAFESKSLVLVHVVESDRALVTGSEYKHWEVYRAGVEALGLNGKLSRAEWIDKYINCCDDLKVAMKNIAGE